MSKYIVFEGVDGAGKSTQAKRALEYLKPKQETILAIHPGATPLGQKLRHLIKFDKDVNIDQMTERILFAADNSSYVNQLLKPSLAKNINVLADRCNFISDIPYGTAGKVDIEKVKILHSVIEAPQIDLLLIFWCPWSVAKGRMTARNEEMACKIEARGDAYFEKVSETYQKIVTNGSLENQYTQKYTKSICLIDASVGLEEVWERVKSHLDLEFGV